MTARQTVLKLIYPILMIFNKLVGAKAKILTNKKNIQPHQSLYNLSVPLNNGTILLLNSLRGKKLLLVNTASDCGYTNQYSDLQKLYETYPNKLIVIAFPANDFKR